MNMIRFWLLTLFLTIFAKQGHPQDISIDSEYSFINFIYDKEEIDSYSCFDLLINIDSIRRDSCEMQEGRSSEFIFRSDSYECFTLDNNSIKRTLPTSQNLDSIYALSKEGESLILNFQIEYGYLGYLEQTIYLFSDNDSIHFWYSNLPYTTGIHSSFSKNSQFDDLFSQISDLKTHPSKISKICGDGITNRYSLIVIKDEKVNHFYERIWPETYGLIVEKSELHRKLLYELISYLDNHRKFKNPILFIDIFK